MFRELAKEKTLISLITGSATSAGALLTFPAKRRFIASKTAQTGSIGVVAEQLAFMGKGAARPAAAPPARTVDMPCPLPANSAGDDMIPF